MSTPAPTECRHASNQARSPSGQSIRARTEGGSVRVVRLGGGAIPTPLGARGTSERKVTVESVPIVGSRGLRHLSPTQTKCARTCQDSTGSRRRPVDRTAGCRRKAVGGVPADARGTAGPPCAGARETRAAPGYAILGLWGRGRGAKRPPGAGAGGGGHSGRGGGGV